MLVGLHIESGVLRVAPMEGHTLCSTISFAGVPTPGPSADAAIYDELTNTVMCITLRSGSKLTKAVQGGTWEGRGGLLVTSLGRDILSSSRCAMGQYQMCFMGIPNKGSVYLALPSVRLEGYSWEDWAES